MSESKKAVLGLLLILSAIGGFISWVTPDMAPAPILWALKLGLPVIALAAGAFFFWASRRKDLAPDFLVQFLGKPFERDGVCFSVSPAAKNGVAYLNIAFQNQYDSPCEFRVVVSPPAKSFSLGKTQFDGVALDIQCDGGAFGVARAPMGVPGKFQGKNMSFQVAAATRYVHGKGTLLRFRNGLRVGKASTSGMGSMGSAALSVALLAIGHIHFTRPASVTLTLPSPVAEETPLAEKPLVHVLWKPGDPTENVGDKLKRAWNGA